MGVRQWMQRQKFNDPVPGTFEVQSCDTGRGHADVSINGMLTVPGIATLAAEFRGRVPEAKVPAVGQVLSVIVDRADPTEFRIEWDQVSTVTQSGEQEPEPQLQHHTHTPAPHWDMATATVLAAHTARVPIYASSQAPGGIVDMTLNVLLSDGYKYSTKARVAFSTPERRTRATERGIELPIRVDPADPTHVVIDIDRIPHW
jgi:hypothetical protein